MRRFAWVGLVVCLQLACSKSPQSFLERGNRLAAAGKYADAELQYRNSILKDPKFAEAYYRLGLVEYKLGHPGEALDDFQRAVDFDSGNESYAIEFANVALEAYQAVPSRTNLYRQAEQVAEVLLKKNPNSFDGLRLRGDVLVIDRKYDEAMSELRKANSIKPNDPDVVLAMAEVLFLQNHDREGEELTQRFLAVRKDFTPIYDVLEVHYVRTKRLADAEHLLQSEIAALPKNARPQLQLADFYRSFGRYQEMSQTLNKITANRANFPAAPALVGDFYADSRRWDDALVQYRAGLQQSSGSDKINYQKRIERALEALGKRDEALGLLNEILKTDPKDPDMRVARAALLRESQDPKERDSALNELKALAAQNPRNAFVHYNLALSYLRKGDAASGWQELKKSSDLRKDYIAPRLVQAQMAQGEKNYSGAQKAAGEVLAVDPNNFAAKLLMASSLIGSKSFRQAESQLNDLSKLQPDSKDVNLELAALAAGEKEYPKAEAIYRRLYRPGSPDLRPLQGLLQLYVLERQPERAETLLENELKEVPDSQPVRMLLASVATQQGKFDLASQQYRWLQAKDPKSPQAYSALGDLYQVEGSTQDALASYKKAKELAPNDVKLLNAIAVLESKSGQPQQAIATLKQQLALDPDNAAAMNNLAFNLAETGTELDRAQTLAEKVARKFPNDQGVIDTLGWVYTKRGLNQSAIQVLRVLVRKYPYEPVYRYHLAVALLQAKQTSDAKRELLAALAEHPPKELSSKIQQNLAQVH
jgi:tetratricopeptide (TPR) repeat protein